MNKKSLSKKSTPCCLTCYETIQQLIVQVQELQSHQNSLKSLNNTLIQTLNTKQDNNSKQTEINWKQKYQEQVKKSFRLQKKLIQIGLQKQLSEDMGTYRYDGIGYKQGKNNNIMDERSAKNTQSSRNIHHKKQIEASTTKFKQSRQKNIRKMEQLINNVLESKKMQHHQNYHYDTYCLQGRTARKHKNYRNIDDSQNRKRSRNYSYNGQNTLNNNQIVVRIVRG